MIPADRWTSGADYDQWMGRWSRLLAHEFLKWLRLPAGLQWIDVCCGSGIVTEAIVEGCAPEKIAAVDASSAQIEFARPHRAHPNVTFEVADAMALPFEDASFDAAVCGLGLNYFPDPSAESLKCVALHAPVERLPLTCGIMPMAQNSCVSSGTQPQ